MFITYVEAALLKKSPTNQPIGSADGIVLMNVITSSNGNTDGTFDTTATTVKNESPDSAKVSPKIDPKNLKLLKLSKNVGNTSFRLNLVSRITYTKFKSNIPPTTTPNNLTMLIFFLFCVHKNHKTIVKIAKSCIFLLPENIIVMIRVIPSLRSIKLRVMTI